MAWYDFLGYTAQPPLRPNDPENEGKGRVYGDMVKAMLTPGVEALSGKYGLGAINPFRSDQVPEAGVYRRMNAPPLSPNNPENEGKGAWLGDMLKAAATPGISAITGLFKEPQQGAGAPPPPLRPNDQGGVPEAIGRAIASSPTRALKALTAWNEAGLAPYQEPAPSPPLVSGRELSQLGSDVSGVLSGAGMGPMGPKAGLDAIMSWIPRRMTAMGGRYADEAADPPASPTPAAPEAPRLSAEMMARVQDVAGKMLSPLGPYRMPAPQTEAGLLQQFTPSSAAPVAAGGGPVGDYPPLPPPQRPDGGGVPEDQYSHGLFPPGYNDMPPVDKNGLPAGMDPYAGLARVSLVQGNQHTGERLFDPTGRMVYRGRPGGYADYVNQSRAAIHRRELADAASGDAHINALANKLDAEARMEQAKSVADYNREVLNEKNSPENLLLKVEGVNARLKERGDDPLTQAYRKSLYERVGVPAPPIPTELDKMKAIGASESVGEALKPTWGEYFSQEWNRENPANAEAQLKRAQDAVSGILNGRDVSELNQEEVDKLQDKLKPFLENKAARAAMLNNQQSTLSLLAQLMARSATAKQAEPAK